MAVPKVTQTFDQSIGEYGQDYAVPVGTPIYSPVAGIASTEDLGKQAWGKRAFVNAKSGLSFAVGHLSSFAVSAGENVKRGQLLGYSGGALSDPSSGNSTGPHVETQFFQMNPKVKGGVEYLDPRNVFKQFVSWEQAIFSGVTGGSTSTSTQDSSAPDPFGIQAAVSGVQKAASKAAWYAFGFALFAVGLLLIFFGDIEKAADKVGDIAEKVAPEAAMAA
jgi:hypothetical protein